LPDDHHWRKVGVDGVLSADPHHSSPSTFVRRLPPIQILPATVCACVCACECECE
jgi:hypothetical protein